MIYMLYTIEVGMLVLLFSLEVVELKNKGHRNIDMYRRLLIRIDGLSKPGKL